MRTIRYAPMRTLAPAVPVDAQVLAPGAQPSAPAQGQPTHEEIDGYLERLLKYVPAEIVTLFIALAGFAAVRDTSAMLWASTVVAVVATPLYLYATSRSSEPDQRPRLIMYVLSPIAFVIWAIYMNQSVRTLSLIKVDQGWATFLLVAGVFVIPLIDMAATGAPRKVQSN